MSRLLGILVIVGVASTLLGFLFSSPGMGVAAGQVPAEDYDPLVTRPNEEGDSGELTYLRYCAGCHGVKGDGKGPAAEFLTPKPRDFTQGLYKFTSTPAGSAPLDEDLLRSITEGLHGTSMPSWRLLSLNERKSLVRHVKSFFKEWDPLTEEPAIPFHENPYYMGEVEEIEKAIEKGKIVYHKEAGCWACHASYLERDELETLIGRPSRDDLVSAIAKADNWGETIMPPDFTKDALKSVNELKDLYRVITAGVGGTAMPTWKNALTAEQIWALTLYVDSLRPRSEVKKTIEKLKQLEAQ